MVQRVTDSVGFTRELLGLSHHYCQQVPSIPQRITQIGEQNPHYLAHEYFNRDWHPMYFAEMQDWLEAAKLSYACSANYLDDFAPALFDQEQQAFLAQITDASFAQTTKDYLLNKQFRKDYWVKGARKISSVQAEQSWQQLRFLLMTPANDIALNINSHRAITLLPEMYQPVLTALADGQVHPFADLAAAAEATTLSRGQLFEILAVLHAKGDVVLVQDEETVAAARPRCRALNRYLLQMSRVSNEVPYLVSPLSGGAITYDRISQLFLLAYSEGKKKPAQWVDFAWQALQAQQQLLIHEGQVLQTEAENRAELKRLATHFADKLLATARSLEIVAD